jgi:hypothetical protein
VSPQPRTHKENHIPLLQGDEALQQWEAWNDMVATHLEKQHNPTMHAIRNSASQHGGGSGMSRSSSVMGSLSVDRHGTSGNLYRSTSAETGTAGDAPTAPHFYVPTSSSFRKHHREAASTPKSRAELFLSAHSPSRLEVIEPSTTANQSTTSLERKRSTFVPPSAAESAPEVPEGPTELTGGNFLVASAPNPLHLFGLEKQFVNELRSSAQTIDEVSAPGSTASGTPRSGRMDSQRLHRLRQVRQEKMNPIASDTSATLPIASSSGSPLRGPTLEDLASGSFEASNPVETAPAIIMATSASQIHTETTRVTAAVEYLSDPPSPQEQPVDRTVVIPELNATSCPSLLDVAGREEGSDDPQDHAADEDILSSLGSTDGHQSDVEDQQEEESIEGGDAAPEEEDDQLNLSTSSADVVPASSADEVARRYTTGSEVQLPAATTTSTRKRTAVEQMTYRKKKELIEKVRTRQQQQHQHSGLPGNDSRSPPEEGMDVCGARSDGGATANASQSNADADVSKDDEKSRANRAQREKKSGSGRRRNTVGPTASSAHTPPLPPTTISSAQQSQKDPPHLRDDNVTRFTDLQPQVIPVDEPTLESTREVLDAGHFNEREGDFAPSPLRALVQLPRPRRKSFVDASSSAASETDGETAPSPALVYDADLPEVAARVTLSAHEQPTQIDHHSLGAIPISIPAANGDSDDDLDTVFQSVIRERSVASAAACGPSAQEKNIDACQQQQQQQQQQVVNAAAQVAEAQAREFTAQARETIANDRVAELERMLEELSQQLEEVHQQANQDAEAHHLRVQRLEQSQSSLLIALSRLGGAAETAEEEDDIRREIAVDEQRSWNEDVLYPFHEQQLSMEVLRYEGMMEEQTAAHSEAWARQSADFQMNIASLEAQLSDAFEHHELDVGTREAAFEEERVELVRLHMDNVEQQRIDHQADVQQMVSEHAQLIDAMNQRFLDQIGLVTANHDAELKSATLHFEQLRQSAEEKTSSTLSAAQRHAVTLTSSVWSAMEQHRIQGVARSAFYRWVVHASVSQHTKKINSIHRDNAAVTTALKDQLEQLRSAAADEYQKLEQYHSATVVHSEALQGDLDSTREELRLLLQRHDELQVGNRDLSSEHAKTLLVNQSLLRRIELLENLAHKAENHLLEQRKELYAQESTILAMKAVQEQSDVKLARLALQRTKLVNDVDMLRATARLRREWSLWNDPATKALLRRGIVAVKQNSDAREELQSWREFLLSANNPKSKGQHRGSPTISSRTASHLSVASSLLRTGSRAPSLPLLVDGDVSKDVCDVLPGEDDLSVSLKYLLARERTEVAAVKSSLVKHRTMLAEGNAAMERMLLEMEILSKQNKELVNLCHRQRVEVPRALQSGEVPRLVQRLLEEQTVQKDDHRGEEKASSSSKQSTRGLPNAVQHTFSRTEGDTDSYVVD